MRQASIRDTCDRRIALNCARKLTGLHRDLQMPADRFDISSFSEQPASRSFLTICSGECLFPFN